MAGEGDTYAARLRVDYPEALDRVTTLLRVIWIVPIAIGLTLISASGRTSVITDTGETVRASAYGIMAGLAVGIRQPSTSSQCTWRSIIRTSTTT